MSEMRDMQFCRLVSQAYVEGFKQGLKECRTTDGKLWTESESFKKLKILEHEPETPQETAHD